MRSLTRISAVTAMVAGLCGFAPQIVQADAASSKPVVVVSGLNNPRQLALVGNDELLIAEAGNGGKTKVPGPPGEGDQFAGPSGSVSVVYLPQYARNNVPDRIVRGLMSAAGSDGSFAVGSDGVTARSAHGSIYVQETYAPADVLPKPFRSSQDGRLLRARPFGALHPFANISRYESRNDPDKKGFDSDPYAVYARKSDFLVADAAGNDILRVDNKGHVRLFHVFPNVRTGSCAKQADPPGHPGCNFVPTSITTDSKGHVYVGGLSSEAPHQGQVVKLSADGKHVLRTWHGFTSVTGVAVSRKGVLYVSELEGVEKHPVAPQVVGVLTRISPKGTRSHRDVPFPAGVVVNAQGTVFVSAWSVAPAGGLTGSRATSGQVWRMSF